jgi:hypothetical protein
MLRTILFSTVVGAVALSSIGTAFAGYDDNPGRQQAIEVGAQCDSGAGSGAFGAFGQNGDYGHDFRGGANGYQTGLNNSAVCGHRP